MDQSRLAISVSHPDGTATRWGFDEMDTGLVPNDLSFTDTTPGGFETCGWTGFRDLNPRADERLFSTITIYGPGGQVAWQGRVAQLPRQTDGGFKVVPAGIGWSSHLMDDETFMQVYVDLGFAGWEEPPLERRIAIVAGGGSYGGVPINTDGGLNWLPTGGQALVSGDMTEAVYTAPPGVDIAKLQYLAARQGAWTTFEAPAWYTGTTPDLAGAATGSLTFDATLRTATVTAGRYAMLRTRTTGAVTPPAGYGQWIAKLAVYGDHGLALHSPGTGEPDGVYASDVIADVLEQAAPLISFTTGTNGTIQPTTFVIPHLAYTTPTKPADVIADANAYHNWDWLVWEGPEFHYRPNGSGIEWQARIGDGAALSLEGDTGEQVINGVVVAYNDGQRQKYAGPVGSGMDVESAYLQDDSLDNPASAAGITRKWPVLPINFPTTDVGAVELGYLYLVERNLAATGGTMTLKGHVRHPTEGMVPVWRIRSGDSIKLTDRPGEPARRIVQKSYSHPTRSVSLALGTTPNKVETLFQRLTGYTATLQ